MDITDQRKLPAYITPNLLKTQSEDPNVPPHTYAPSWASTNLTLTPVVFPDQTNVALNASGLAITWKRKDGSGAETALNSNEEVTGGILRVNSNVLASSFAGMTTRTCYISYYDSEAKNTVNITPDITYTLVRNAENAKLAYVTADTYVFKYNTSSALVGASQATLSAQAQGVSTSKWQYKNSSDTWAGYPTTSDNTSITDGTLVVKPAHAVFINNVAQIKLLTDDTDVYDTISITKMYNGSKGSPGPPGAAGTGSLSIILGNEAQTIVYSVTGAATAALDITIPFTGCVGITQTACICPVGTLPSGMTLKTNTTAITSIIGSVVLTVAASATLGGESVVNGTVDLTFTISGKTAVKEFTWAKSTRGSNGTSAAVFSVYAPNGTIVTNQSDSLSLVTPAYSGTTVITNVTYQRAKYTAGRWTNISGTIPSTLTISGTDIANTQSYRRTTTYNGKSYVDVITVEDKSDPYVSELLSIGGFTVKNNQGGVCPCVIVHTNQQKVDALLGPTNEAAPSNPAAGAFWYKISHSTKAVALQKYFGSTWINVTEKQLLTYNRYAQDKDGNTVTFSKTGKVIYLSAADIDSLLTLQCDVSS